VTCRGLEVVGRWRARLTPGVLLAAAAVAGLPIYLAMNHLMVREVAGQLLERGLPRSMVYASWMGAGYLVLFALAITARRAVLMISFPLFLLSVAANYAYAGVFKRAELQHLTPEVVEWMAQEVGQVPQAWAEYGGEFVAGLVKAAVPLFALLVLRALVHRHPSFQAGILGAPRARALAAAAFLSLHGLALLLQPSYSMAETNTLVFGLPCLLSSAPQAGKVTVEPANHPLAEKILLVVDESITYDAFRTIIAPRLGALPVVEFGEAASIATCSATSNALLRWGVEWPLTGRAGYDPRSSPMLWGYAKAAGFRTVLIDGQSKGSLQNFIGINERALIDEFVAAEAGLDTDSAVAAALNQRLRRPGPELILVTKRGAHFPYELAYPAGTVAPDASKAVRYAAAVAYSTSAFFGLLSKDLDLSQVFLIYTSDHGQVLDGGATHCSATPRPEEYTVPIAALTGAPALQAWLQAGAGQMHDHASHSNIYATLLYAMGYQLEWVEGRYGRTLAGPPSPYHTLSGYLPFPTRRMPVVEFSGSVGFPRRESAHAAASHSTLGL
jgi:hypothetical protein